MNGEIVSLIPQKFDSLTGVYERSAIEDFAKTLLSKNIPFSILLIDGDNFKNVNDNYGHKVGDLVIQTLAEKITKSFCEKGLIGRFGGDEFYVVMPETVEYDDVWHACHDCFVEFEKFAVPGYPAISITITIGLSRSPEDGKDFDVLFEKADKALYRGKQKGRSCFIIYLDSKHKDIKVLSSDTPSSNSMQLHNTIFSMFTKSKSLAASISYLLEFFTTTLMIDHVGIQGKNDLLFSEVYSLSRGKNFSYIDNALISLDINSTTSIFYINDIRHLKSVHQETLIKKFEEQQVISSFFAEISYDGNFYGFLRADSTSVYRIWQNSDMDLLLTAAKVIGMSLHYEKKTLEDLKSKD